ncbi:MAG: leucyl/phenylalanyl-tRNA--protein transferase [Myxococcota bacterium]
MTVGKPRKVETIALSPELLRVAYARGLFPMPHPDTGVLMWFRPDPRAVFPLDGFHCSRSLARTLRGARFAVTFDSAFAEVMRRCGDRAEGTWITQSFHDAYGALHRQGDAHSVEVWRGEQLVGGVYGVALGGGFFAESMFHAERDASKVALFHLVERLRARGFVLLEAQFMTPHLASLGAIEISDRLYRTRLAAALEARASF